MADEWTLLLETDLPKSMTCADGTGIEKGTLLTLSDPHTAAACSTHVAAIAGVAAEEKIASDGRTVISVYTEGEFKATASGSITAGDALVSSGGGAGNRVETGAVNDENLVGVALETATAGETFRLKLIPRSIQVA